jgi:sirohydrochlorin ferrochelatase
VKKYGVLVISHGSRSNEWVRLVDEAVADVRLPRGVPRFSSFLEIVEGRLIQDGIDVLEAQGVTDIIALPLFVSSGSTHVDEISYALGVTAKPALETDLAPYAVRARIHFLQPIDDDPMIAEILYRNIRPLSMNAKKEVVLVIGHGSIERGFHEKWRQGLEKLAARVKTLGRFAGADAAMLLPDQVRSKMNWWHTHKPEYAVIVAPLFLGAGYFTNQVIPERLSGCTYRYNGKALLPDPLISRWMERQLAVFFNNSDLNG